MNGSEPSPSWVVPPAKGVLVAGEVHLWRAETNAAQLCVDCCAAVLSAAEQERAAKFRFAKDRRLYTVAHAALRSILADYLNITPTNLQFDAGANGKPRLAPALAKDGMQFNLSHSHELALIAVTREREIGVDVERVKEDFAFDELAERYFTAREVSAIRALPKELRRRAFYQCWTSKEAFLKAKGVGLSGKLDEVQITLNDAGKVEIQGKLAKWSLVELHPASAYVGALALQEPNCQFKYYQWRPLAPAAGHAHS